MTPLDWALAVSVACLLAVAGLVRTLLRTHQELKAVAASIERRSDQRLQAILDNSTAVIYMKDLEGRYLLVNRAFEKLFHVKRDQTVGKTDRDLFAKDFADRFIENDRKVVSAATPIEFEETAPHDDGPRTYISLKFPLFDERERVYALCGISTDITDRKLAVAEVARLQSFLSSIVENIPDMIFVKDAKDLKFVLFNRAGEELLGYPRKELLGKSDYDFFPAAEADAFTRRDREVLEKRRLEIIPEEPIHTREKGLRWLHTKKIPIRGESGEPRYLLGISEDITDRKKAEEALRAKSEELARERAEREHLELFAYLASHDLQEPLQKVVGFAELLRAGAADRLDEKSKGHLDRIEDAAIRLSTLIGDLLEFSRIATGSRSDESLDLNALAADTLKDLELRVEESGARVDVRPLPRARGDRLQVRQLFQNLLSNAIKFRRPGEAPRVTVTGRDAGDGFVEIEVKDEGIGFSKEEAERIFRPFERLHSRDRFRGSGLGLAICRKIAERHGGSISARSEPGKGSSFVVRLPAGEPA